MSKINQQAYAKNFFQVLFIIFIVPIGALIYKLISGDQSISPLVFYVLISLVANVILADLIAKQFSKER